MDIYLVGGAVRDRFLGIPVRERDYVVVGATEDQMLDLDYKRVGSDFPVFLHPKTSEEYALARTERKIAPGHKGFECKSDSSVTLEEDLQRRDLTINAIAESRNGEIIDPYGGQSDLDTRVLRHVSNAFVEDPLRILRIARFKARFHHLGFDVHPTTTDLLRSMIADGLHRELTPERVLLEFDKALGTDDPAEFFIFLEQLGAAQLLWPEINLECTKRLADSTITDVESRFALLMLDATHDEIQSLCQRLRMPRNRLELTIMVARHLNAWSNLAELSSADAVDLILSVDGVRRNKRFLQFNNICEQISDLGIQNQWSAILKVIQEVKARDLAIEADGPELGQLIRIEQVKRVAATLGR
ncbi:MAG: multifunctional CCA tRNA nucleotidyl transferase/2'3'-cyclic phosphodiesterase/2'nucleotidase/phosphatase [Gammaproteobacteria bacterium]|jgi:tRNA nucleotidyltransferase (CCA-adding enzyme)|nr:multifunctional CCA tRNA nucleotidyl transferase/2'3'-cyclic phosphodiesterase/2'nucleotidase/phosphatase [Gammaproteobacteria bacterium]